MAHHIKVACEPCHKVACAVAVIKLHILIFDTSEKVCPYPVYHALR